MSKVSINLVTWNGEKYIENSLRSVFAQTFTDFSIIIIDNGSTDQTLELINERYPHLKIVKQKENLGFSKAYNQTIHWTKSDYVLCLNQDVILNPNFLAEAVQFLDQHTDVGAVTGKILRLQEAEKTNYIDTVGLKLFKNYRVIDQGSAEVDEGQYDLNEEIFGVSGVCPVYRRKALEDVKYQQEYFDESFFSYKEDVDLAHRLQWMGWKAWRVPSMIAHHDRSVGTPLGKESSVKIAKSWKKKSKFAKFYSYRNHLYFLKKNALKLSWSIFWYELVKFFYVLLLETRNLRAWSDYFRNKKALVAKRSFILGNKKVSDSALKRWFS